MRPCVDSRLQAEAPGPLILVAEDDSANQRIISQQLQKLGYSVEIADDGQQALRRYQADRFDLLLTDCDMPNMDGFDLTTSIRRLERDHGGTKIPIVAVTASATTSVEERCYAAGMDDFMTKPVTKTRLGNMLRKWLPQQNSRTAEAAISSQLKVPESTAAKSPSPVET